jgi:hypothetical protein
MVQMAMREKQIGIKAGMCIAQGIAKGAQTRAAIQDDLMAAAPDFNTGGIAAISRRLGTGARDAPPHAPELHMDSHVRRISRGVYSSSIFSRIPDFNAGRGTAKSVGVDVHKRLSQMWAAECDSHHTLAVCVRLWVPDRDSETVTSVLVGAGVP